MNFKASIDFLKEIGKNWGQNNTPLLAAALTYHTLFSMAPIFIIAIAVAGWVFGAEAAQGQIVDNISDVVGNEGAEFIEGIILNANRPGAGVFATIIGVILMILGASNVFLSLQKAMNAIWHITNDPKEGLLAEVKRRLIAFSMVMSVGALLFASLIATAVISGISKYFDDLMPAGLSFISLANLTLSVMVLMLVFGALYKTIPRVDIQWKDVWLGALIASVLFNIVKQFIGLYFGRSSVTSTYGAASSLVLLLLWLNYSYQIFLFGAEFSKAYTLKHGSMRLSENSGNRE